MLLSILVFFIFWTVLDRARLIRDNDNERLFNVLLTSLRGYEDFGSAIESNAMLKERITGFGIYGNDLTLLYSWGKVPPVFDEKAIVRTQGRNGRYTLPDKEGYGVKFILRTGWGLPPPRSPQAPAVSVPRAREQEGRHTPQIAPDPGQEFVFFNTLIKSNYLYIDIAHPAYSSTRTAGFVLFPLTELALLILVVHIMNLNLRNREYGERIEAQKNLVVLGTAASTLAHEIKNPLLSIRLQTGILGKIFADSGGEELGIINEEVDRLSALTYRVNDYLRDAKGEPVPLNSYDALKDAAERLCGRNVVDPASVRDAVILMDDGRARSVLENLLRNALESGGPAEDLGASVARSGNRVVIAVFDRGKGIPAGDLKQVFDPFFTSKSTGTGIGLSISKRFTEAAGGEIVLENREGGGIAARMVLPEYTPASGGPGELVPPAGGVAGGGAPRRGGRPGPGTKVPWPGRRGRACGAASPPPPEQYQ
jgi:two-component system sensor histidine kinase HydH